MITEDQPLNTVRVRLGFRAPLFPNAFIAVVYLERAKFYKVQEAMGYVQLVLTTSKYAALADRFVCEPAPQEKNR